MSGQAEGTWRSRMGAPAAVIAEPILSAGGIDLGLEILDQALTDARRHLL